MDGKRTSHWRKVGCSVMMDGRTCESSGASLGKLRIIKVKTKFRIG